MFNANQSASRLCALPKGRYVTNLLTAHQIALPHFLGEIRSAVLDVLPALIVDARYTTEALVGPELWNRYSPGLRRIAGTCMAHLVERGELPLVFYFERHKYPLRFCLPGTQWGATEPLPEPKLVQIPCLLSTSVMTGTEFPSNPLGSCADH